MKLRYERPKGRRFKRTEFFGVTTFDKYWWSFEQKRWIPDDLAKGARSTHFYPCRSVRAFKRRLRQWSCYLPSGVEFILCSRYVYSSVYGKTRGQAVKQKGKKDVG